MQNNARIISATSCLCSVQFFQPLNITFRKFILTISIERQRAARDLKQLTFQIPGKHTDRVVQLHGSCLDPFVVQLLQDRRRLARSSGGGPQTERSKKCLHARKPGAEAAMVRKWPLLFRRQQRSDKVDLHEHHGECAKRAETGLA